MRISISIIFLFLTPFLIFGQKECDTLAALTAQKSYVQVLSILEGSEEFSSCENYFKAIALSKTGNFEESNSIYDQLVTTMEVEDNMRPIVFYNRSMNNLRTREYESMEANAESARKSCLKIFGQDTSLYTKILNTLGYAQKLNGHYFQAVKSYEKAKSLKEKRFENDIQFARILNNLGEIYRVLNQFDKAEINLTKSLELKGSLKGQQSVDYSKSLFYLSVLYQATSRYEDALFTINEALSIIGNKKAYEALEIGYMQLKVSILQENNLILEALDLSKEVLSRREELMEDLNSDYAKLLLTIANLEAENLNGIEAKSYYERSIITFKEIHGNDHPYYGIALRSFANFQLEQNLLKEVLPSIQQSISIIGKTYGRKHIEYFKACYSLLKYYNLSGLYKNSFGVIDEIQDPLFDYMRSSSKYLSNKEMNENIQFYNQYHQELLFLNMNGNELDGICQLAFQSSLFFKGYLLQTLLNERQAIRSSIEISELSLELSAIKEQIGQEIVLEIPNNEKITKLNYEESKLSSLINRKIGAIQNEENYTWRDVQFELEDDEVALDFVRIHDHLTDNEHYGVFILKPYDDAPDFVSLFKEDKIVSNFTQEKNSLNLISSLYDYSRRSIIVESQDSVSLYDYLWEPINKELDGVNKISYCADGIIHRLSLQAVPIDLENTLMDKYEFLRLSSFNSLFDEQEDMIQTGNTLLVGGVDYGTPSEANTRNRNNNGNWSELPWTLKEIEVISSKLENEESTFVAITGSDANEVIIKSVLEKENDFSIIHFATHGFFEDRIILEVNDGMDGGNKNWSMSNSGLVLAGANNQIDKEDNMWSAYEISQLDLSGTQLAVLSACETGLGQVYENEGVYGLQRAFKIAGVEYVIMSLWQVPDRETKEFMTLFYDNYLNQNQNIIKAFNATQQVMKDRFIDPEKWAGFVLLK